MDSGMVAEQTGCRRGPYQVLHEVDLMNPERYSCALILESGSQAPMPPLCRENILTIIIDD